MLACDEMTVWRLDRVTSWLIAVIDSDAVNNTYNLKQKQKTSVAKWQPASIQLVHAMRSNNWENTPTLSTVRAALIMSEYLRWSAGFFVFAAPSPARFLVAVAGLLPLAASVTCNSGWRGASASAYKRSARTSVRHPDRRQKKASNGARRMCFFGIVLSLL